MSSMNFRRGLMASLAAFAMTAGAASAATLDITITNNQSEGGLFLTPLFTVFHDGSFDTFDRGGQASGSLEALAEEGDVSGLIGDATSAGFESAVITSPGGFPGAPVIDPGETATVRVTVDETMGRYFSFLSMVIPSNDNFIGNGDATAHELFDDMGRFTGLGPIALLGSNVYDAGTEANNGTGAAFSTAGGVGTATDDPIQLQGPLDFLLNTSTPAGIDIISVPGASDLLATIQVSQVPLPAGMPLVLTGLGAFGALRLRKRRKA
jgi:hypothetical protein